MNDCGGYYCSEEHGHIDCWIAKSKGLHPIKTVSEFLADWKVYGDDKEFQAALDIFIDGEYTRGYQHGLSVAPHAKRNAALYAIKLFCLTTKLPGPNALGHIVRLCIDAGVTEHLEELEQQAKLKGLDV